MPDADETQVVQADVLNGEGPWKPRMVQKEPRYRGTSGSPSFRDSVSGLPFDASPETTIEGLSQGDRIARGLVVAGIRRLLLDPPEDVVASITSLSDAYETYVVRWEHSSDRPIESHPIDEFTSLHVRLRPVADADIPDLYASALDPRWSFRWRYRGATPSLQDFAAQLFAGAFCQFVVERRADRRPVGLVTCYNARTDEGWCYVAFSRISTPLGGSDSDMLEGGFLFICFLFRTWNFRKLYAEVPGWNWDRFEQGSGSFFEVEGVLTDHEYFDGRYWDTRIVALRRSRWDSVAPSLGKLYGVAIPPRPAAEPN